VTNESIETRSYRILGVLGKGGFGKVYRARMEGTAGFSKDVAIKLLSDDDPGDDVLQRFRDESRILGLIRDRAIVSVDPPTRLNGRWAVIMECVDGASARALLRAHGPMPVSITLEIVQEVARALHHVYHQPGPSGDPLELVHRDLKPANLQLTDDGQVKILDFGTARARFEAREAETTRSIAGTYGYIAPERLQGVDTSAGDVYSLGMVLYRLLTARKADPKKLIASRDAAENTFPEAHRALVLASEMCSEEPDDRPTAREVEDRCRELRREVEGPELRMWAREAVPPVMAMDQDALVGKTLSATFAVQSDDVSITRSRTSLLMLASLTGVNLILVIAGVVTVGMVVFAGALWINWRPPPEAAPAPAASTRSPRPAPAAVPDPAPPEPAADDRGEGGEADETGELDDPDDPDEPGAADEAAPGGEADDASPEPAPPRPAPRRAGPPQEVTVGSVPWGAKVLIDGAERGVTPLRGLSLTPGTYQLSLRTGSGIVERSIEVGDGQPNTYQWTGKVWLESTK